MGKPLKPFQEESVADLYEKFAAAQQLAVATPAAVLLNAPTGSGKTLMTTALIDRLLAGSEDGDPGDDQHVFVWLTDDPELNKQTYSKMIDTSSELSVFDLVVIDGGFDAPRLEGGSVYFLNTQKLGTATSFVKTGDGRQWTLWETLQNTVDELGAKFVLIIDEAHRGARGRDAAEAETIMQKFLKGNGDIGKVDLVLGVSATPERFVKLCTSTNRPLLQVDVDPDKVRESGLLKEYVDLYHPDEAQPNRATMLVEGVAAWQDYTARWAAYAAAESEPVRPPIMLVQVEDAKAGSNQPSVTDLAMVIGTLAERVPHGDHRWIAHAFQEDTDLVIAGHTVRRLAPSAIDGDPDVKVVLFKTSLNTGWDCPRAEVMVSFRSAQDDVNIAQLIGRMVRAPLARSIDFDDHLNTVALYLPYYNAKAVERVVRRLTGDPANVPPTKVREGKTAVTLKRAHGSEHLFARLATLPTYTIPRTRAVKPVPRLAKLAALLGELKLIAEPVATYRTDLVGLLISRLEEHGADEKFVKATAEAALLEIRRRRFAYGKPGNVPFGKGERMVTAATIEDADVELLFADSGRLLGEGLHREYLRMRLQDDSTPGRVAKLELYALLQTPGVLDAVNERADALRQSWIENHKAAFVDLPEKFRAALRDIEGSGPHPEQTTLTMPMAIESTAGESDWPLHLYVDEDGQYTADFRSSWERRVLEKWTKLPGVVAWLRNPDRKPWSVCIPRRAGTKWTGVYPDFLFFRDTISGVLIDIVDPHLLADPDAPQRAAALAQYAQDHAGLYGRIELVIFLNEKDHEGKALDLMDNEVRAKVAKVSTHDHLKQLFEAT